MIVAGHEVHLLQPSFLQTQEELIPGCLTLSISNGETEHLPHSIFVHPHGNQEAFGDYPVSGVPQLERERVPMTRVARAGGIDQPAAADAACGVATRT